MQGKLLFLGTGGSSGVPMIGCRCGTCVSTHSKNKRLRPSALLTVDTTQLLIDVGPDFRTQALQYDIERLDGVLLTHTHFDHVAGLDELRVYYVIHHHILPVLSSAETLRTLKKRYDYLFVERNGEESLTAQLDFQVLAGEMGCHMFCGLPIRYMSYQQGGLPVNGFQIGSLAYLTDVKKISDEDLQGLEGVEVLVISALREQPSKMHLTFEEAIQIAQKIGAKQTYFTHLGHETEYVATAANLPSGYTLAHDGLEIFFTV